MTPDDQPLVTPRVMHDHVLRQIEQMYFRQSMINDALTCRMMALFRWVIAVEEEEPWLAGILGTAGHEVIYHMHQSRKFNFSGIALMGMFEEAFQKELASIDKMPPIPAGFDSLNEALQCKMPEYIEMLQGYQSDSRNQQFHTTMHEQGFVLEIPCPDAKMPNYIFSGTIDQNGFYDDGTNALRDMKFKVPPKPGKKAFDMDIQMTIYAYALKWGNPVCDKCKPYYEEDLFGVHKKLVYKGPCTDCRKKIGTPLWPRQLPELCQLVWMRDYEILKRGYKGKKKGDRKGDVFIPTTRTRARLEVLMSDILRFCKSLREGEFYREPGEPCNFWCKYTKACRDGLELDVQEVDLEKAKNYGTEDPF